LELSDIVGQEPAMALLQRQLSGGRPHHALLFAGPRGVGRQTTAVALARTLLCEKPGEAGADALFAAESAGEGIVQACGKCRDCRMIDSGAHPDFQVVAKELAAFHPDPQVRSRTMQELGIAVIKHFLIMPAGRSANRGRGKVFIVREAELMSNAAQDALLKTLEEPPPGVTIILLTSKPDRLLPTTLSRCCRVNFRFLPRRFVTEQLAGRGMDTAEADFWAGFTAGSLGRAIALSEAGMYATKQEIVRRLVDPAADGLGEFLTKVMDDLAEQSVKDSKKDAESPTLGKNLASRQGAGDMLELIASLYRDALSRCVGSETPIVNSDQPDAVDSVARRFRPEQLADIIEQLSEYERLLWRNVSAKTLWENLAITASSAAPLRL
ncbi:MAG: ATP-binding protein, partial [Phycisphaerae bacterium]